MNCSKYFHSAPLEPIKTELKSILCCIVFRECGSRFYSFASMLTSDHIVGTLWHNIEVAKKKFKHIKHKKYIKSILVSYRQDKVNYENLTQSITYDCYGYDNIDLNNHGALGSTDLLALYRIRMETATAQN